MLVCTLVAFVIVYWLLLPYCIIVVVTLPLYMLCCIHIALFIYLVIVFLHFMVILYCPFVIYYSWIIDTVLCCCYCWPRLVITLCYCIVPLCYCTLFGIYFIVYIVFCCTTIVVTLRLHYYMWYFVIYPFIVHLVIAGLDYYLTLHGYVHTWLYHTFTLVGYIAHYRFVMVIPLLRPLPGCYVQVILRLVTVIFCYILLFILHSLLMDHCLCVLLPALYLCYYLFGSLPYCCVGFWPIIVHYHCCYIVTWIYSHLYLDYVILDTLYCYFILLCYCLFIYLDLVTLCLFWIVTLLYCIAVIVLLLLYDITLYLLLYGCGCVIYLLRLLCYLHCIYCTLLLIVQLLITFLLDSGCIYYYCVVIGLFVLFPITVSLLLHILPTFITLVLCSYC